MPRDVKALPELLDTGALMAELNVKRTTAEAIKRQLPKVQFPGAQKSYVTREDVRALVAESTVAA